MGPLATGPGGQLSADDGELTDDGLSKDEGLLALDGLSKLEALDGLSPDITTRGAGVVVPS